MRSLWITAVLVFAIDQISKVAVVHWMDLGNRMAIDVFPPLLNLRMGWNYGINFGLFSGGSDMGRWVLIALSLGIVFFVLRWVHRDPPGRLGLISAGLLAGGALGNVVDRIVYGAVADFLNMSCCGISNPFVFNVADIAIFAGAFGLVLFPSAKGKKVA